jgi:hypothetical protein
VLLRLQEAFRLVLLAREVSLTPGLDPAAQAPPRYRDLSEARLVLLVKLPCWVAVVRKVLRPGHLVPFRKPEVLALQGIPERLDLKVSREQRGQASSRSLVSSLNPWCA